MIDEYPTYGEVCNKLKLSHPFDNWLIKVQQIYEHLALVEN